MQGEVGKLNCICKRKQHKWEWLVARSHQQEVLRGVFQIWRVDMVQNPSVEVFQLFGEEF
jgi:hypothetical protein